MTTKPRFIPEHCEGFAVSPDPLQAEATMTKLERYRKAGNHLLSVVMDWDDTAAKGTWPILRKIMPEAHRRLGSELYKKYGAKLRDNTITPEESEAWQQAALGGLVGLKLEDIEKAAREEDLLRPGTKELFETCKKAGMAVSIRTAAIEQFVQAALEKHDIVPDELIATRLLTNEGGYVQGWAPHTMTHSHNKGSLGQLRTEHTVVLGDGMADRFMVSADQDALFIRANGGFENNVGHLEEYLCESFSADPPYEMVTVKPDLIAVNGLVEYVTRTY